MGLNCLLWGYLLLFICRCCSNLTGNTPMGLYLLFRGQLYFLFVDDVRTSQETPMGHHCLLLRKLYFYRQMMLVPNRKHFRVSTAHCGDSLTFYI
jgi:hypothetical protein